MNFQNTVANNFLIDKKEADFLKSSLEFNNISYSIDEVNFIFIENIYFL